MLDKMDLDKVGENPAVWEKVVHKLRTRAMPPAGRPRPDVRHDRIQAGLRFGA